MFPTLQQLHHLVYADVRAFLSLTARRPDRHHRASASRQAGAAVYLTGRTVDAAAARQPGTIGQTAVHAEDNALAASLMSHRLSPQDR